MAATFSISPEVRAVLEKAEIGERTVKLVGQLERKLYVAVNKVLEGASGKWDRKLQAHVFERDPRELLGLAIATGVAKNVKQELQAFYTPAAVAGKVVKLADLEWGQLVLEPSCGDGALAEHAAGELMFSAPVVKGSAPPGSAARAAVRCYEIDPVAIKKARERGFQDAERLDFLEVPPEPIFDRVVMNPPFAKGAALEHVLHAFSFLKAGGKLVSVMPGLKAGSYTARAAVKKAFEALLVLGDAFREDLPPGSFRESGTDVAVHLLRLTKPRWKRATRRAVAGAPEIDW